MEGKCVGLGTLLIKQYSKHVASLVFKQISNAWNYLPWFIVKMGKADWVTDRMGLLSKCRRGPQSDQA